MRGRVRTSTENFASGSIHNRKVTGCAAFAYVTFCLPTGLMFEPLRQFRVARGNSAHLPLGVRVSEALGSGQYLLGPRPRVLSAHYQFRIRHELLLSGRSSPDLRGGIVAEVGASQAQPHGDDGE
jgi:hypothetical protein